VLEVSTILEGFPTLSYRRADSFQGFTQLLEVIASDLHLSYLLKTMIPSHLKSFIVL
jgi:hypothetical protein